MSTTDPNEPGRTPDATVPVTSYTVPEGQVTVGDEGVAAAGPGDSTKDVAKGQASAVADDAKAKGQQLAGTAKDEARNVASQAGDQAKTLFSQVRGEVSTRAGEQQSRLAQTIRSLGDELSGMAEGGRPQADQPGPTGLATQAAGEVSTRLRDVASWLEGRDPNGVIDDVKAFARRRPGTFLAVAAGIGLLAGRVTRSLADDARQDEPVGTYSARTETGGYESGTQYLDPEVLPGGAGSAPVYGTAPAPGTATGEIR